MTYCNEKFNFNLATISPKPLGLEISSAKGSYIYDVNGKAYLDFVAGVSACNLGHGKTQINQAIIDQLDLYSHVMVYGEFIQKPLEDYSKQLIDCLPKNHQKFYPTNSGTEAMEGAIKMAKKVTKRSEIITAKNSYHGSSQGSLSIMGIEANKNPFRPLIPGVKQIEYNNFQDLSKITAKTAAVVLETIQGGAGFIVPENDYLNKVWEACIKNESLLILDEIQTGFGRIGTLFGFQQLNVIPDILVIGKAMASGLPVGGFTASSEHMNQLTQRPLLGHITTFGGHPVVMASASTTLELIQDLLKSDQIEKKEMLFKELLNHDKILEIRGKGLMLALILPSPSDAQKLIAKCLDKGLITFGLLWEKRAIRITPPLTISTNEIKKGCGIILRSLQEI